MGRNHIYYHDFSSANIRYRVIFIAASNEALPSMGITPTWNSDPLDSIWVRIPGRVMFAPPENDSNGYKGSLPVGSMTFPTMKLAMNIRGNLGSTVLLQELRDYLVTPVFTNGGSIYGRSFDTYTRVDILSDRGNQDLSVDEFFVYYRGVHRKGLSTKYKNNRANKECKITVELTHQIAEVLSLMSPKDISETLADSAYTIKGPFRHVYCKAWKNASGTRGYARRRAHGAKNYFQAYFVKWADIWGAIRKAGQVILRQVSRDSSLTFSLGSSRARTGLGTVIGTPYDAYYFFKDSYLPTGDKGASLDNSDWWLLSYVDFKDQPGEYVGGYLVDRGKNNSTGIYRYDSMIDYISDHVEGGVCKMQAYFPSISNSVIVFSRIKEGLNTVDINSSDFKDKTDDFESGSNIQTGATIGMQAAREFDPASFEYKDGPQGKPDFNISLLTRNIPDTQVPIDFFFDQTLFGLENGYVMQNPGFRENDFYYFDTPDGWSEEQPFMIHNYVGHDDGASIVYPVREKWDLPTPDLGDIVEFKNKESNSKDRMAREVWIPLTQAFAEMIGTSCMHVASAKVVTRLFGNDLQTTYNATVSMKKIWYQNIGDLCSEEHFPNANIFIAPETFLNNIPGKPIIVKTQDSPKQGLTKVELFALSD